MNKFASIYFNDCDNINLDFYVAKFDAADTVEPIEAYKNGHPVLVSEIPVWVSICLFCALKNQTPENALLAEIQWDTTVARYEADQHDRIDKNLQPC